MTDDEINDQTPPGSGIRNYAQRLKTLSGPAGGLSISPRGSSFTDGLPMPTQGGYAGRSAGGQNDLSARLDAATKQAETYRSAPPSQIIASKGITVRPGSASASGDGWASAIAAQGVIPRPGTQAPASAANPMLLNMPPPGTQATASAAGSMLDIPRPGTPIIHGNQQDPMASYSRANAARQSMIDAQRGGVHILGGGGGMDADRQALLRKTMTAHPGAQNGQLTAAQLNAARGIMSDAQGESIKQTEISQRAAEARQRGMIEQARLGIDMQRFGADQDASNRRYALDVGRYGMAQEEHAGRMEDAGFARQARQGLTITANSMDQEAKNAARMQAIAAGVLKPQDQAKLQTVQTDSGVMVFDPTTGRMTPAVGPDGQPVGSGKPLNEGQSKAVGYGTRAAESSRIIDEVGQGGKVQPSLLKRAAESVPLVGEGLGMVANQFASPEQQQVEQAQRDYVNAVLRQESGAAISQSEFDNARRQYFPQPGDSPEVVEQKRRNRETAIDGFRVAAGPGAKHIAPRQQQEQAPQQGRQTSRQQPAAPTVGMVSKGFVFLGGDPANPENWMEARQ